MSNRWPFSLLNDEQMSNKLGVEHQPAKLLIRVMFLLVRVFCFRGVRGVMFIWKFPQKRADHRLFFWKMWRLSNADLAWNSFHWRLVEKRHFFFLLNFTAVQVITSQSPPPPQLCQGLNSHYFHIIGDGHQPNSRGLYTHYKDSVIKGGRSRLSPKNATTLTLAHLKIPQDLLGLTSLLRSQSLTGFPNFGIWCWLCPCLQHAKLWHWGAGSWIEVLVVGWVGYTVVKGSMAS